MQNYSQLLEIMSCGWFGWGLTVLSAQVGDIVPDHIMQHYFSKKNFSTRQHGFIKGRSAVIQLFKMLDD